MVGWITTARTRTRHWIKDVLKEIAKWSFTVFSKTWSANYIWKEVSTDLSELRHLKTRYLIVIHIEHDELEDALKHKLDNVGESWS